jgi:hypothetical protein
MPGPPALPAEEKVVEVFLSRSYSRTRGVLDD